MQRNGSMKSLPCRPGSPDCQSARVGWAGAGLVRQALYSSAFLMVLPGPHMSQSSQEFTEVLCLLICQPSLGCRDREGLKVGNRREDLFREHAVNATMEGPGLN